MIRIGVCDDEAQQRAAIRLNLEAILNQKELEYSFFEFSSGEGLTGWVEKHPGEMDLLFLDIEMGGMNGVDTARALRAVDEALGVVFLTGYADHVFDGYEVNALDYILKPARRDRLETVLVRALAHLHKQAPGMYSLHNSEGTYRLPVRDFLFFQSDKRQVIAVTEKRSYAFYGKLAEVEAELAGHGFVRVHQRYLVNKAAVAKVGAGGLTLQNGGEIPISRALRQHATAALLAGGFGEVE